MNKAIRDSSRMIKDKSFAELTSKLPVFCHFLSGLDDRPVSVQDELASLAQKVNVQIQSQFGSAEEIYLDRSS